MKQLRNIFDKVNSKSTIAAFLIILILASMVFADRNFLSTLNMLNIFTKSAKNGGLLALGMAFVILVGEIDLSVGAVLALSGVVMGLVGQINPILGIFCGLLVGVLTGSVSGFLVTKMKISSWIASLAMMFGLRGLILIISDKSIPIKDPLMRFANIKILPNLFNNLPGGINILIPIFFILTFLCIFVAQKTKYGMRLYAVGGNKEAAKMMGINVDKTKIVAFICSGLIASIAGVLLASASGSATLRAGDVYETYAIAMCAIGGIKLTGGEGKFNGVFFGILIYFTINTIFTYLPSGISVHWQNIIMGLLVLISISVQSNVFKKLKLKKIRNTQGIVS